MSRFLKLGLTAVLLVGCEMAQQDSGQPTVSIAQAQTEQASSIAEQITSLTNEQLALIDAAGLDFEEKRVIDDYDDVRIYLEETYKVGDEVTVTVQRGSEARDIQVTLVEEPSR